MQLAKAIFNADRCKGCGLCVTACPKKIVILSNEINAKGYQPAACSDQAACIGCAFCAQICPDSIITVEK